MALGYSLFSDKEKIQEIYKEKDHSTENASRERGISPQKTHSFNSFTTANKKIDTD
jgi:hypothetical protein